MPRVLAVEDQLTTGALLEYQLRALGDLRLAADEEEAERDFDWLLAGDGPRMGVVDLGLPSQGVIDPGAGFRVIDTLAQRDDTVPVIVLTIRNDRDALKKAGKRSSIWFFFTKPWNSKELLEAVADCLAGKRPERTPCVMGVVEDADEN